MRINLPTDILRSFVAIADAGSMIKATEQIFLTQSALSLQMKRLSDILQAPIFVRHRGALSLTPTGQRLLEFAREILELNDRTLVELCGAGAAGPIRIGMVQDFADQILSGVLAQFAQLNPDIELQIRIENSLELVEQMASGLLDLVLYLAKEGDEMAVTSTPITWIGNMDLLNQSALPLALMTKPCIFRDVALNALESADQPYRLIVETHSISALRAAVEAGLAITCRTEAFMGRHIASFQIAHSPLPKLSYCLGTGSTPSATIECLSRLIREAIHALDQGTFTG